MAVQETHLTPAYVDDLHSYYNNILILNTPHPENPTGAGGSAIVLNKHLTNHATASSQVIVPGRAILVTLDWHRDEKLTALAIYAPTEKTENHRMWEQLENAFRTNGALRRPDIMLGDFNFVEDPIDRFPAKLTTNDAPGSFSDLKHTLNLRDGWRETYPAKVEWTWRNNARSSMSRIDRVYMTPVLLKSSRNWEILLSEINACDHSRVVCEITCFAAPEVGPGRWTMTDSLTFDKVFMTKVNALGITAHNQARTLRNGMRSDVENVQTVWTKLKADIAAAAKARAKILNCSRATTLRKKTEERDTAAERLRSALTDEEVAECSAALKKAEEEVYKLKSDSCTKRFETRSAKNWLTAETQAKSWYRWVKEHRPKDVIIQLRKPGSQPPVYVTSSRRMSEIAQEYHESLQNLDTDVPEEERAELIQRAREHVLTRLSPEDQAHLAKGITAGEIADALTSAKNGKAAGRDGMIYELWKSLKQRFDAERQDREGTFNVVDLMTLYFEDIEVHGLTPGSSFADGWMCPLYKKGDQAEIANYRPITLLNTDYKIYTKALASRLAVTVPSVIDVAQAGFVRGRSITDHTKITSLITHFAEAEEQNGAIVALDQEKAYDKIRHDYLGIILREYGLPERLVKIVESLYRNAYTMVMVNGILSPRYRVTRGVRQGDPLSCLLFNLAIEPLSAMLRTSTLRGYKVPGINYKLIATLYADDTTVYLAETDSYATLEEILRSWCKASGAKFNIAKTEIVPLGTPEFRQRLVQSRMMIENGDPFPAGVRIARDGEPTRILGTWPGNKVVIPNAWTSIVDRVRRLYEQWEKKHPTVYGRGMLSQVIAGGHTQFLTAAQGMPTSIEQQLDRLTLSFFWSGKKRHPLDMMTVRRPQNEGGANLFHAAARNDAQYLTWVSAFLAPRETKPLWTFLADPLFKHAMIGKDKKRIPENARINPFCQTWRTNQAKLPFILKQMIRVARKYHLALDAPEIPDKIKLEMPIWGHHALLHTEATRPGVPGIRCLKTSHAVRTIEDLEELAEPDDPEHEEDPSCFCEDCIDDRAEGCRNPHRCRELAAELLGELAPKWSIQAVCRDEPRPLWDLFEQNRETAAEDGELLVFDSTLHQGAKLEDYYRLFVHTRALEPASASDTVRRESADVMPPSTDQDPVHAAIAGALCKEFSTEMTGGMAVVFPDGDADDISGTFDGPHSFLKSIAVAAMMAALRAPTHRPLHIVTRSKQLAQMLGTRLAAHEQRGWLEAGDAADAMRGAVAALRRRSAETTLTLVTKKAAKDWQCLKDARLVAEITAELGPPLLLDFSVCAAWDKPGIGIQGLRQRTAHQTIKLDTAGKLLTRRRTVDNLTRARASLERIGNFSPTKKQIWDSLRSRDLSRGARGFIWKGIHEAHKIGDYFSKMPAPWKDYAKCTTCNCVESMMHILFECPDSGHRRIWDLAHEFLERKRVDDAINIGAVWGCAAIRLPGRNAGAERAFRIIVSESAFLIWKIRCEKRIEHADSPNWRLSDEDITARWVSLIRGRRAQDQIFSNRRIFKRRALDAALARETWEDLLDAEHFCNKMRNKPGVLVGIGTDDAGIG